MDELGAHERLALGRALLVLMEEMAQEQFGVEREQFGRGVWSGVEYDLWAWGDTGGTQVPEEHLQRLEPSDLHVLAHLCGGWWTWEEGPVFVPLDEWNARVEARSNGLEPREVGHTDDGGAAVPGSIAAPRVS